MNGTKNNIGEKDLRPLVLVLFAVTILIAAAVRGTGWLADHSGEIPAPQQLVWRDGAHAPGLYRVEADSPPEGKQPPAGSGSEQKIQAPHPIPARLAPLFFKPIPVNQADTELLTTIPGIGPVFARRIIEFRDRQGRINAIEELDAVPGVGPAKLKILSSHLVAD
jgi:hypothetical protein